MRGRTARRTVRHFGLRYDYSSRVLRQAGPIPGELTPAMHLATQFAGLRDCELVEESCEGPEPRSGRVAEAREHPPETAVLRPGQLGEGEPEVAVEVGPEPQCPEAGAG